VDAARKAFRAQHRRAPVIVERYISLSSNLPGLTDSCAFRRLFVLVKRGFTIGPQNFENLLAWLDSDRERAAEKYEKIRQRLTRMLVCRGCWEAEDLVDETIDRVARKVDEIRGDYIGDPAAYFGGVARHVYQEWLKKKPGMPPASPKPVKPEVAGPEYDCLEGCLDHLTQNNRALILGYYRDDKQAKIDHRRALAKQEGIEIEALRLRVHRIRKVVRECVIKCIEQKVTTNEWTG